MKLAVSILFVFCCFQNYAESLTTDITTKDTGSTSSTTTTAATAAASTTTDSTTTDSTTTASPPISSTPFVFIDPRGNTTIEERILYRNHELGTFSNVTDKECITHCLDRQDCVYWSKEKGERKKCEVYGSNAKPYNDTILVAGKVTRKNNEVVVNCVYWSKEKGERKKCEVYGSNGTTPGGTSTIEERVYYTDDVYHDLHTDDEDCMNFCLHAENCVYWSKRVGKWPLCRLQGPRVTKNVQHNAWVSGEIKRFADVGTKQEGVLYRDHQIGGFVATSDDECNKKCIEMQDCVYWSKKTGEGQFCELHGSSATKYNQTNRVSGVITRSSSSVYCIETSTRYIQDDLEMKKVNNTDECHSYCKNMTNCTYWSKQRVQGEQDCFLSGPNAVKVTNPNFIGGEVNCTTPGGNTTIKEGVFYVKHKLGGFGRANDDECNKYCVHRENCAYWSKKTGEGQFCELYKSDATQYNQANWVSGVITRFIPSIRRKDTLASSTSAPTASPSSTLASSTSADPPTTTSPF